MNTPSTPHVLVLFSGGLDSLLAAKLMQAQGLAVTCLHYCTPFFGKPALVPGWEATYGLSIRLRNIGPAFVNMMRARPPHGFGSALNPCIDCKILMLRDARTLMEDLGACALVSGEVLGQRPMSQRRDALDIITREAGVKDILLRPLSARHLSPTHAEQKGLIDRAQLLGMSGRSRKPQLALAKQFGITAIPAPAGGCRLTEQESARSYFALLHRIANPLPEDFVLAATGRQFWHTGEESCWLTIGRNQAGNDALLALAKPEDILFELADLPSPLALGRFTGQPWSNQAIASAAAFMAQYSTKAVALAAQGETVRVRTRHMPADTGAIIDVLPGRTPGVAWEEPLWETASATLVAEAKEKRENTCAGTCFDAGSKLA